MSHGALSGHKDERCPELPMFMPQKVHVCACPGPDESYVHQFSELFSMYIQVQVSEGVLSDCMRGDDPGEPVEFVLRRQYLRTSAVTVVLLGPETWRHRCIDWLIAASLRESVEAVRSGLLGILLPHHPAHGRATFNPYTIPQRLYVNLVRRYAELHDWQEDPRKVFPWIHEAFRRRRDLRPDNTLPLMTADLTGETW